MAARLELPNFHRSAADIKEYNTLCHAISYARSTGKETMQKPSDKTVEAIRTTLNKGQLILLVGGPSGAYGQKLQRDPRFRHYISTESHGRANKNWTLQPSIGCVLVSRYIDASLTRIIINSCADAHIPCFGTYHSCGGIQRTVDLALALPDLPPRDVPGDMELELEEAVATAALARVDQQVIPDKPEHLVQADRILAKLRGEPVLSATQKVATALVNGAAPDATIRLAITPPAATPQIAEIRQLFADARAAVDLAEEAVVQVLTANAQSLKAMARLQKIADLMKEDA